MADPEKPETPVATPEAPETPETPETPQAPETPETPETPEEPETPETPEEPEEPEEPAAKTLEELQAENAALLEEKGQLEQENAALKEKPEEPEEPAAPAAPAKPEEKNPVTKKFLADILPAAEKAFLENNPVNVEVDGEGNVKQTVNVEAQKKQFKAILDVADKGMTAMLADHVFPYQIAQANEIALLKNEVEIRDLRESVDGFKAVEKTVRARLSKVPFAHREIDGAVRKVYDAVMKGGTPPAKPAAPAKPAGGKPPVKPAGPKKALRDVSAPNKNGSGTKAIKLTAEQEDERKYISEEQGFEEAKDVYMAKLRARQQRAKATNAKIPQLLREM